MMACTGRREKTPCRPAQDGRCRKGRAPAFLPQHIQGRKERTLPGLPQHIQGRKERTMFSKLSHPGIVMDNFRSLSLSLMTSSVLLPLLGPASVAVVFGAVIGGYYGYRMEKQTHELRSLGGRVMRGKTLDYLILSQSGVEAQSSEGTHEEPAETGKTMAG